VDDARSGPPHRVTLRAMSIEMQAVEVYRLANTLRAAAGDADLVGSRLRDAPRAGTGLDAGVGAFLDSHRAAGRALAGELGWLGDTLAAVADSWLQLDRSMLAPHGRARAE
jgi:hypothetical protein